MSVPVDQLVTAKFVLDSTGFSSGLRGINAELRNARSELQDASAQMGTFGRDSEKLKSVQEALARQVELHAKKVELYKTNIEDTTRKMNDNIKERDRLKESLDKANKSYDEAVKLYGKESEEAQKAKAEVDKLTTEYEKKEKAIESNAKSIQNYETNMNRANAQMNRAQGELNKVTAELAKSESGWIKASEVLQKHSEKLKKIGSGMEAVGKGILKATAPLVGLGAAALKVSSDFEEGMSNVQAISGATGEDLDELREKAKYMGETTKFSATESAEALTYMAMAGWETGQMLDGIEGVMMLAAASGENLGAVSDIVTDALTAFGLAAEDAGHFSDVLAKASSSSNTNVGMMGETFKYVAPLAGSLGYSVEDTALAIGLLANAGIKGGQAGTTLRGILTRLVKPTKESGTAMDTLGISMTNTDGTMKDLSEVMVVLREKLGDLDPEMQSFYAAQIAGQEGMSGLLAIINASDEDFNNLQDNIDNSAGAAKEMADIMNANVKGQLTLLKSQLEGIGIQFGEILLPMASKFIGKLSELATRFSELSPETREMIVKLSGLAVGIGGVLLVGGKLVTGVSGAIGVVGKLAGVIGTATTATATAGTAAGVAGGAGGLGALVAGLGGAVVAAGPFLLAGAAVAGVGYAVHKSMSQEAVPAVDLFADHVEMVASDVAGANDYVGQSFETAVTKISEGTQEAVGAYLQLDEEASQSLLDLYVHSTEITEDMAGEMVGKYQMMADQIKAGMDKHHEQLYTDMEEFFAQSSALTEEEEAAALEKLKADNEAKRAEIDAHTERIQKILEKASEEKRALTLEEQEEINEIQDEMKVSAVKSLSETEIESQIILERLKEYSTRITTEQAAEVIAKAEEQRIKAVGEAEKQYEDTVANIIRMRDETGVITEEQADKLIADAERQKKESIKEAEKMKTGVVEQITKMNADIIRDIDTTDGSIKTRWQKLGDWFRDNPIIRWIKTMTANEGSDIEENWIGTNYFRGGLTTLHERGYEIYDLPRGTRIYNHEASEDLVRRTAAAVADRIAAVIPSQARGDVQVVQHIHSPAPDPRVEQRRAVREFKKLALGV